MSAQSNLKLILIIPTAVGHFFQYNGWTENICHIFTFAMSNFYTWNDITFCCTVNEWVSEWVLPSPLQSISALCKTKNKALFGYNINNDERKKKFRTTTITKSQQFFIFFLRIHFQMKQRNSQKAHYFLLWNKNYYFKIHTHTHTPTNTPTTFIYPGSFSTATKQNKTKQNKTEPTREQNSSERLQKMAVRISFFKAQM